MDIFSRLNWIDWLVAAIFIFAGFEGWNLGFINLLASFIAYSLSVFLSFRYYDTINGFVFKYSGIGSPWSILTVLIIIILFTQIFVAEIFTTIFHKLSQKIMSHWLDNLLGLLIALLNAFFIICLIFYVLFNLPIKKSIAYQINKSYSGITFLRLLDRYGSTIKKSLKHINEDLNQAFTYKLSGQDNIQLNLKPKNWDLYENNIGETELLSYINNERRNNKLPVLVENLKLSEIAAKYSLIMYSASFLGHIDRNGNNLENRLKEINFKYESAAENLAFAADIITAHRGLMQSQDHRNNILNPEFVNIGIGIVDGSDTGVIITEIFTK